MIRRHGFCAALLAAATTLLPAMSAHAHTAPPAVVQGAANIKRTVLQKIEVPGSSSEAITALAEVVPGVQIGKHSHFGVESGYLLSGDFTLLVDGKPELVLKGGDSYQVLAGVAHDGKSGPAGAKLVVTYIVEEGKPLATPAK